MIAARLPQQRACADFCEIDPAAYCLEEPCIMSCVDSTVAVAVTAAGEDRVVPDRRRGRRRGYCDILRVAADARCGPFVKNVLHHVLHMRKLDVQGIGK